MLHGAQAKMVRGAKAIRKRNTQEALTVLGSLSETAKMLGIDVRSTYKGNGSTLHVMFNMGYRRLLDYWPATGTTLAFDGQRSDAADPDAALELAKQALERHPDLVAH